MPKIGFVGSDGLRPCAKCHERKPLTDFTPWRRNRNGVEGVQYSRDCNSCGGRKGVKRRNDPVGFRTCSKCRLLRAVAEFSLHRTRGYQGYCRGCERGAFLEKKDRESFKAKNRNARFVRKYGITAEVWSAMLAAQGGGCAICGGSDRLHVDHSHATGKLRAILCHRCNLGLGQFRDDVALLRRVIAYLESHIA